MVMKMAANSIATSCIGAQVNAFSTRTLRGVVHQESRLMAMSMASRIRPLTGNCESEADWNCSVAVPDPAREHRQRDGHQIEHVVQAIDAKLTRDAALALELRRARDSRRFDR